jgi:hypothetical protein
MSGMEEHEIDGLLDVPTGEDRMGEQAGPPTTCGCGGAIVETPQGRHVCPDCITAEAFELRALVETQREEIGLLQRIVVGVDVDLLREYGGAAVADLIDEYGARP